MILIYDFKLPTETPFFHLLYEKWPPGDLRKKDIFQNAVI